MKTERLTFEKTPLTDHLGGDECILDITASGRYWRTSHLEMVSLLSGTTEKRTLPEKEADEYEMLAALSEDLAPFRRIITFNGRAFDIPHLTHKFAAYGMPDPLTGREIRDLYSEYRHIASFLSLPSRRLFDYAAFFGRQEAARRSDAQNTLVILSFDALTDLLGGNFVLADASGDLIRETVVYTLLTEKAFPSRLAVHDEVYHLTYEGREAQLAVHLRDGKIRCYHTDTENYDYLPLEGYSIHRSMSVYVDKTRKEKAVRENCFHLAAYSDAFLHDRDLMLRYIRSALDYLGTR